MKHGDFTKLAKQYINRPGYSLNVLNCLLSYMQKEKDDICIADVGAGTGKLTENLSSIGLKGFAVEPNDAMRSEGERLFEDNKSFKWLKGYAEDTTLDDESIDWVLMGSSFHWTDAEKALKEFHRILKPNGFFTAIWNPRDIEKNEFHMKIEENIKNMIPDLKRVSSGARKNIGDMEAKILSTSYFDNLIFIESPHEVIMTKERYLGAWRSVNDIQVQAGKDGFEEIMKMIENEIKGMEHIIVPYKSRAWTVRKRV